MAHEFSSHGLGAAKAGDLYTDRLPEGGETWENPEARSLSVLDDRIAAAHADLREASAQFAVLLAPSAEETGGGVLANVKRFCEHAAGAITHYFAALLGHDHVPDGVPNPEMAAVLQRIDLDQQHLHDLEEVRTALLRVRDHAQNLELTGPDHLLPQAQQLRTEISPISDMLRDFAWRPIGPADAPFVPPPHPSETGPGTLPRPELPLSPEPREGETVTFGDPEADKPYWHLQRGNNSCAIVDQEMILDKLAGTTSAANEFDLVQEAIDHKWASEDGASFPNYVGKLLEARGIHTETVLNEDLQHLAQRLSQHQEAIVGVRAEVLWGTPTFESGSDHNLANHAVWVTGVTFREHNGRLEPDTVIVNDSGVPDGCGRKVPAEQFLRAWNASNDHVIYAQPR